ncbi:protein lava lamp [Anopheles bellator]|uniref:protein lava lamp n=1 Tax=Anopheles bellator TaxID=139047 RepID=UPI002649DF13|nr:protein lava lamp [Anopheles bellator]
MSGTNVQGFDGDPELLDLQSSFNEQQAKISALREIIRQTEAVNDIKHATAQEKVKNIAQRLTHFKTKVTSSRLNRANSSLASPSPSTSTPDAVVHAPTESRGGTQSLHRGRSESSGLEKCTLLREQIEQNRQKMAARESCKREIEEKVSEIKHKLETTLKQAKEKPLDLEHHLSAMIDKPLQTHDYQALKRSILDTSITHQTAVTQSETTNSFNTSLDRNEACEKLAYLENQNELLQAKVVEKNGIIEEQLNALSQLASRLTGSSKHGTVLKDEVHRMQVELLQKKCNISIEEATNQIDESTMHNLYEQDEGCRYDIISLPEATPSSGVEKRQDASELEHEIELHTALQQITSLEQVISSQSAENERMGEEISQLRQALEEKTIEVNVMAANVSVLQEKLKSSGPKPLFPKTADEELEAETAKLKQQLDESNKNMIKCKLKVKQLQKQVDTFRKSSNVHAEIASLTEEVNMLTERLAEAEAEAQVGSISIVSVDNSGSAADLRKRVETLERTCQNQVTAMQLLEEQKNDLNDDLSRTRSQLLSLREQMQARTEGETVHIASQMLSIELEEQLEKCLADKSELSKDLLAWETEKMELHKTIKRYMDENGQLLAKIDKLSIEKVSSAESIEVLENLTQHEKQEMEKSEKRISDSNTSDASPGATVHESREDLNDNLLKLMEESKELMEKVELFTDERREVLEKLDAMSIENQAYICELDKLKEANEQLRSYSVELVSAKSDLEDKLKLINDEKECIRQELNTFRLKINEGKESDPGTAQCADPLEAQIFSKHDYEHSILTVENDISNYTKIKDKQKRLQTCKKLSVSAKQLVTLSKQLLEEYERMADERNSLSKQVAALLQGSVKADGADSDRSSSTMVEKTLAEVKSSLNKKELEIIQLQEHLTALNRELKSASEKIPDDEPQLLQIELNAKNDEIMLLKKDIDALVDTKATELLHIQQALLEAQNEIHQLKTHVATLQRTNVQLVQDIEGKEKDIDQLKSIIVTIENTQKSSNEEMWQSVQHKQETIDTMNAQIIELYRTIEERCNELAECKNQLNDTASALNAKDAQISSLKLGNEKLSSRIANLEVEQQTIQTEQLEKVKENLTQKNEELLEKLKKFAANLKKKNTQCNDLEVENQRLCEENRTLLERVAKLEFDLQNIEGKAEVCEENQELAQKLHHLNNELHRLLELKYQMESEFHATREELRVEKDNCEAAQTGIANARVRLEEMERELNEKRAEMDALHQELTARQMKIDKCKAIIKEKIKEAQRLQEHERRTAYLEDELRMTQSKLEEFHNQTLLLGRLKNEKEELNAAVRVEAKQRRSLEVELQELKQTQTAYREREENLAKTLTIIEGWLSQQQAKWSLASSPVPESVSDSDKLLQFLSILEQIDKCIAELMTNKNNELNGIVVQLHEAKEMATTLSDQIHHLQKELQMAKEESTRIAHCSQEHHDSLTALQCDFAVKQRELQNETSEKLQRCIELEDVSYRLQEAQNENRSLREANECLQSVNLEKTSEIDTLYKSAAACDEETKRCRAQLESCTVENDTLKQVVQQLQQQVEHAFDDGETMRAKCDRHKHLCDELTAQVAELTDARIKAEQQLEPLHKQCNDQLAANEALTIECAKHKNQIALQRSELEEMERITAELQCQSDRQKQELAALQTTCDELCERLNVSIEHESTIVADCHHYKLEYQALTQEVAALKQANETLKETAKRTQEASEAECDQLRQECERLRTVPVTTAVTAMTTTAAPCSIWDEQSLADGWGDDTVRLEESLHQKESHIQQLTAEKEMMQQEITDLKVKSGKLLRKLKECRSKSDCQEGVASSTKPCEPSTDSALLDPKASRELRSSIDAATKKYEDLQREYQHMLARIDTLETACEKLTEIKEAQDKQIEALIKSQCERDVEPTESDTSLLKQKLAEVQHTVLLLEKEKNEMSHELETMNEQILQDLRFEDQLKSVLLEVDAKNVELQMLRSTLQQMQSENGNELNMQNATLLEQVDNLKQKIISLEQNKNHNIFAAGGGGQSPIVVELVGEPSCSTSQGLPVEVAEIAEATDMDDAAHVRSVLKEQEVEIVTLRQQLAVRSAEYARLAAHVDPARFATTLGKSAEPQVKLDVQQSGDRVSQAELELALYMIYQRDMRCDELEIELRNLLEERDALQLRLSNALRMHEEFRLKMIVSASSCDGAEGPTVSDESSIEATPEKDSLGMDSLEGKAAESTSSPISKDLSSKLSELHSISYSKEKHWQEERESRNRQLTLIQRDLANMPLEAAAKIVGADVGYTEAAPQQSASSVLINWILGKK